MTVIRHISPINAVSSISSSQFDKGNVFLFIAQVQGALAEESMKKQEDARTKLRASRLMEGIMAEIVKHGPLDTEKMKARLEEIKESLRGNFLSSHLEEAMQKVDSMLVDAIRLKEKVDKAAKEAKDIASESNKEVREYNRLKAKLASKERELSKYSWVPGYGGALAIEVLVLKGRVSSAAEKVKEVQERLATKQVELNTLGSQLKNKQEILTDEISIAAKKLSTEAQMEIEAQQKLMDSALHSIHAMTGGN